MQVIKKKEGDVEGKCKCEFFIKWLDGEMQGNHTVVRCKGVCLYSRDPVEEVPQVKTLIKEHRARCTLLTSFFGCSV
jgi:hypothetical protein